MNTQSFTHFWNIARFIAIGIAFCIFLFYCFEAEAHGGFAPNLEVELETRSEQDEKETSRQESEKNDSGAVVHFDDKGNDTIFIDGGELK